ncbi:serine/threonine protein kinase [Haliangium ochraceum DSM 14365]|uniref:non-specific serine/threonine protein kinase n=1 Tax=Haliangium ochraceum (strain DSM 14365 / JCM 11303 / SMP-2) TaxID=502025 RepID=D0LH10_HALO1|nr:serine/threonine protein kinase [Haliangium ochraceum DSM 14365]
MLVAEGQMFGSYRVVSQLGSGGMGAVYLAEQPLIGKRVALKVIHEELAHSSETLQRFFNEARAVNTIGNEHVVEIHDVGQTPEGAHYFVMEYLAGPTLAATLRDIGALPVARALHIAAQIADALAAAHAVSIIHRDLKPDNIMLTPRHGDPDFVKVLDFGLAKTLAESNQIALTAQGAVLGTPQFMSPEVCESGKGVDHRTDIYSLGVLLFQMSTGRVPFEGSSMGSVLLKHVTEPPPPPRALNPEIPPSVEQIILRCLAKSPAARFPDMGALRQALLDPEGYLATGPPVVPAAGAHAGVGSAPLSGDEARPRPVRNRTMSIDTPEPGRPARAHLVLLALLAILGASAGALAVVLLTEPGAPEPPMAAASGPAAPGAADAEPEPAQPAAQPAARDPEPAAAAPATVSVRLVTRPAGAQVFDAGGALLGETPVELVLPRDGAEHELTFRHPRAGERRKTITADSDAEYELALPARDAP